MLRTRDLTGQKFGRLMVVDRAENHVSPSGHQEVRWKCQCDCGNMHFASTNNLIKGTVTSCGCGKIRDLTGQRFGRLVVLGRAKSEKTPKLSTKWVCKCDCGNIKEIERRSLTHSGVKSCGCLQSELMKKRATTHGMTHTRIYSEWRCIKSRCYIEKNLAYKNYGARGIKMFEEWINDFDSFYSYVSKLPLFGVHGMTLDRIDNDGDYVPGNLRWATKKEQGNNRRTNVRLDYKGEILTISEWSERLGINQSTIRYRIGAGKTIEEILNPETKRKQGEIKALETNHEGVPMPEKYKERLEDMGE